MKRLRSAPLTPALSPCQGERELPEFLIYPLSPNGGRGLG
jgi:hypothetical protein